MKTSLERGEAVLTSITTALSKTSIRDGAGVAAPIGTNAGIPQTTSKANRVALSSTILILIALAGIADARTETAASAANHFPVRHRDLFGQGLWMAWDRELGFMRGGMVGLAEVDRTTDSL